MGPLQSIHLAYSEKCDTDLITPPGGDKILLYEAEVRNVSGGAIAAGVLRRFQDGLFNFFTLDDSATPDAVEADGAKTGTTTTIFTTTDNDGFLVQSPERFELIGFNVTQAEGGTPTYSYQYWDGSAWQDLSSYIVESPSAYSAGNQIIVFKAPLAWVAGSSSAVGGDTTKYTIRARATTAPSTAVQVDDVYAGQFLTFDPDVGDKESLKISFPANEPYMLSGNEALIPYFGSANAANLARALYKIEE